MPQNQFFEQGLAARLEGCTQTPKHDKNYARHDPRGLAHLTDRSTNSTPDEILAAHREQTSSFYAKTCAASRISCAMGRRFGQTRSAAE